MDEAHAEHACAPSSNEEGEPEPRSDTSDHVVRG
jgi:hypothetical protein